MTDYGQRVGGIRRYLDGHLQAYADRRAATNDQQTIDPWAEVALLTVFAVAFWLIASSVPPNGDDWAWGSQIGVERLTNWFDGYNGRYTGNIIVLLMTRMGWFTSMLQALGLAAMIGLILDITHNRTVLGYVTLSTLVLLMPAPIWRQTLVWVSGYANYVTATLIMLIFIRSALLDLAGCRERPWRISTGIGIFIFALFSQLVVEHMTIYLLSASIAFLLAGRLIQERWSPRLACWMAGFGFGAFVMFSNSSYRAIVAGESVKTVAKEGSSFFDIFTYAVRDRISTYGLTSNAAVILVIAGLIAAIAVLKPPTATQPIRIGLVRAAALVLGVTAALMALTKVTTLPDPTGSTKTVAATALLIGLILLSTTLLTDLSDRMVIVVSIGSWLLLNAPLLVVYPIPPRTFLPAYVLLLMVASVLTSNFKRAADDRTLTVLIAVVACVGLVVWKDRVAIYRQVNDASNQRIALVRDQIERGSSHVELQRLPHQEWMARADPFKEPYPARFKVYYDLPEDLSISPPS